MKNNKFPFKRFHQSGVNYNRSKFEGSQEPYFRRVCFENSRLKIDSANSAQQFLQSVISDDNKQEAVNLLSANTG